MKMKGYCYSERITREIIGSSGEIELHEISLVHVHKIGLATYRLARKEVDCPEATDSFIEETWDDGGRHYSRVRGEMVLDPLTHPLMRHRYQTSRKSNRRCL